MENGNDDDTIIDIPPKNQEEESSPESSPGDDKIKIEKKENDLGKKCKFSCGSFFLNFTIATIGLIVILIFSIGMIIYEPRASNSVYFYNMLIFIAGGFSALITEGQKKKKKKNSKTNY